MRTLSQQELNTVSGGTLACGHSMLLAPVKLAAGLLMAPFALIGSLFRHHGASCGCVPAPKPVCMPKPTCDGTTPPVDNTKET